MERIALPKINWSLSVLGRRRDGYHLLDTLMQTIDLPGLRDTLWLRPASALSLAVEGPFAVAAGEDNLVLRAARLLQEAAGVCHGAAIRLQKGIPWGAGLGGGSADAAQTLLGLNEMWGLRLSVAALDAIAVRLGADVPFFLRGGLARVGGIGESIRVLCENPVSGRDGPFQLVIVLPEARLSTAAVFAQYDRLQSVPGNVDVGAAQRALLRRDYAALAAVADNALEPSACALVPEIAECMVSLVRQGALYVRMTGSGSAVFGIFSTAEKAKLAGNRCGSVWAGYWS